MLHLKNIRKSYITGPNSVEALKGVSLRFRRNEFVSILGASGCGKTTMLNIVGGLDRYTDGDLIINGKSTKDFTASDWDTYRNKRIGFVFQSYNLIPHLSVLGNVEMALTLSGLKKEDRAVKAKAALEKVGLTDQINKRPNQLSGGQMQRVAIARAIVNNPEIVLADEPTGALDSKTSVQIMELLKEIARDRLIIMVTHNNSLAEEYSTRIVRLFDGLVTDDSRPCEEEEYNTLLAKYKAEKAARNEAAEKEILETHAKEQAAKKPEASAAVLTKEQQEKILRKNKQKKEKLSRKKSSMNFFTAMSLSAKNLFTKKGRTTMVSFAGSIGIIGIALVLAISNGFSLYINRMQASTLAEFPLAVMLQAMTPEMMMGGSGGSNKPPEYPDGDGFTVYEPTTRAHINNLDEAYDKHINDMDSSFYNAVYKSFFVQMTLLQKNEDTGLVNKVKLNDSNDIASMFSGAKHWYEALNNPSFMETQLSLIGGKYPTEAGEIAIIVDKYNRLSTSVTQMFGLPSAEGEYKFTEFMGKEFKIISNENLYNKNANDLFEARTDFQTIYNANSPKDLKLKVVGFMRPNEKASVALFDPGILYTPALTQSLLASNTASEIGQAQIADTEKDVITGTKFSLMSSMFKGLTAQQIHRVFLQLLGASPLPSAYYIYPKDFTAKAKVLSYLDEFNSDKSENNKVVYTDAAAILSDTMGNLVDIISYVLVSFAGVSLVVSSIMIGIITYVSVIERTKEIGVLRSIGARKKDISRVFNAETLIIGFIAGLLGVLLSYLLSIPINLIISAVISSKGVNPATIGNLAILNPLHALLLIVVSCVLTLISGLIPSQMAAKKDPVVALRSE